MAMVVKCSCEHDAENYTLSGSAGFGFGFFVGEKTKKLYPKPYRI